VRLICKLAVIMYIFLSPCSNFDCCISYVLLADGTEDDQLNIYSVYSSCRTDSCMCQIHAWGTRSEYATRQKLDHLCWQPLKASSTNYSHAQIPPSRKRPGLRYKTI